MSKFRVELDIAFDNEDDAIAFLNLVEEIKDRVFKGTGEEEIAIVKKCRYHECFHDEIPPQACGGYVNIDIDDETLTEHKNSADTKIESSTLLPE